MYSEDKVTYLQDQLRIAIEEVSAENPEIEGGFEADLAVGIALTDECTTEDAIEFFRREIGWVPTDYARIARVPATDFLEGEEW